MSTPGPIVITVPFAVVIVWWSVTTAPAVNLPVFSFNTIGPGPEPGSIVAEARSCAARAAG